jgi:hypothetical protein
MLRLSTTENGWTVHFDDLTEIATECRNGDSNVALEVVEAVVLALYKLGHIALPETEPDDDEGESAYTP